MELDYFVHFGYGHLICQQLGKPRPPRGSMGQDICHVIDCDRRRITASGLCLMHDRRLKLNGNVDNPGSRPNRPRREIRWCSVDSCGKQVKAKNLCSVHYVRFQKYGDPLVTRKAPNGSDAYTTILRMNLERMGDCLLWTGPTWNGYGSIGRGGSASPAHRVSYEKWHGPIAAGLDIDHTCHNEAALIGTCPGGPSCAHRRCLNPAHLRAVSSTDNLKASPLVGIVGQRVAARRKAARTHCRHGHEFTPENTYRPPTKGGRECRTCMREATVRYEAKRKAHQ